MLNRNPKAQVCDATDDASSNADDNINKKAAIKKGLKCEMKKLS